MGQMGLDARMPMRSLDGGRSVILHDYKSDVTVKTLNVMSFTTTATTPTSIISEVVFRAKQGFVCRK